MNGNDIAHSGRNGNGRIVTFEFFGVTMMAIPGDSPAATLIAMRPMVEGMGIRWQSQHRKAMENPILKTCVINLTTQVPGDSQSREWTFLPLTRVGYWLATIHSNKVPDPETREKIVRYQNECADAIFAHFFNKAASSAIPSDLAELIRRDEGISRGIMKKLTQVEHKVEAVAVRVDTLAAQAPKVEIISPQDIRTMNAGTRRQNVICRTADYLLRTAGQRAARDYMVTALAELGIRVNVQDAPMQGDLWSRQ